MPLHAKTFSTIFVSQKADLFIVQPYSTELINDKLFYFLILNCKIKFFKIVY
jgi:hypothetical protein